MRCVVKMPAVNMRRYGKVWVAKIVNWPVGKPPVLEFGGSVDDNTAEIEASESDVIRYGRKDHRGNGTVSDWAILQSDGTLLIVTASDAREHYLAARV